MASIHTLLVLLVVAGSCYAQSSQCRGNGPDTFHKCVGHVAKGAYHVLRECKKWWVKNSCPHMCGLCKEVTTTIAPRRTEASCTDEYWCVNFDNRNCLRSDLIRVRCPNKSNACNGQVQPPIRPVVIRTEPVRTPSPVIIRTEAVRTPSPVIIRTEPVRTSSPVIIRTEAVITPRPATTERTTRRETIRILTTFQPTNGVCADLEPFCLQKSKFVPQRDCASRQSICIKTCGSCRGSNADKCQNLSDRALDCSTKNCLPSDPITKHRNQINCSKTCCMKGQLE